jgi:hypothetical protein
MPEATQFGNAHSYPNDVGLKPLMYGATLLSLEDKGASQVDRLATSPRQC